MTESDISGPTGTPATGEPAPRKRASPTVLWGVIGALAVTVAALGGVLIGHRSDPGTASTAQAVPCPASAGASGTARCPGIR